MAQESSVELTRIAAGLFQVTTPAGHSVRVGTGPDAMSPVELLLAALAACSSIDADTVLSRRGNPERFVVNASAQHIKDEQGRSIVADVTVTYDIIGGAELAHFPVNRLVARAAQLAHETTCTVSRTIENSVPVNSTAYVAGTQVWGSALQQ